MAGSFVGLDHPLVSEVPFSLETLASMITCFPLSRTYFTSSDGLLKPSFFVQVDAATAALPGATTQGHGHSRSPPPLAPVSCLRSPDGASPKPQHQQPHNQPWFGGTSHSGEDVGEVFIDEALPTVALRSSHQHIRSQRLG